MSTLSCIGSRGAEVYKKSSTGYLVVKLEETSPGYKCIPACWVLKTCESHVIIRYPTKYDSATESRIKMKQPFSLEWPIYYVKQCLRTESYEDALAYIEEKNNMNLATITEIPDNTMEKAVIATPSTSSKRKQSNDNHTDPTNDSSTSKKKLNSFIPVENTRRRLIHDKQLYYFGAKKPKHSPKNSLPLNTEGNLTKKLENLIRDGNFKVLEEVCSKSMEAESLVNLEDDDDCDREIDNTTEKLAPTDHNIEKSISNDISNVIDSNKTQKISETASHETVNNVSVPTTSNSKQANESVANPVLGETSLSEKISVLEHLLLDVNSYDSKNNVEFNDGNIKQIENVYNTILDVKNKLDAVYQEADKKLKEAFESIKVIVCKVKPTRLPTFQHLTEPSQSQEKPHLIPETESELDGSFLKPSPSCTTTLEPFALSIQYCIDSKLTLKHPRSGPGLIELLDKSGVYIVQKELAHCIAHAKNNVKTLALSLIPRIFTIDALKTCILSNKTPRMNYPYKPGLDQDALNTLVRYCIKYGKKYNWLMMDAESLLRSLRIKLTHYKRI